MSLADRRLLAWMVSLALGCLGVVIAVRAVWPGMFPSGGGLGAVSLAFPSLSALPVVIVNVVLGVIARRRGGRAGTIGSFVLWTIGVLVVVTLAVSLTPPAAVQAANSVLFVVLFLLLALGGLLPTQLLILAVQTFVLIGSPRAQRAAGD
jgi:hypothetical protein